MHAAGCVHELVTKRFGAGIVEWVLAAACLASALCTVALPIETKDRGLTVRMLYGWNELPTWCDANWSTKLQLLLQCPVSHDLQETLDHDVPSIQQPLLGSRPGPSEV